jgi:hypothetical protein
MLHNSNRRPSPTQPAVNQCRAAKLSQWAACATLLLGGTLATSAATYTLDNSSSITLQNGTADVVVYPTDIYGSSTLSSGGYMFPDSLSLSPVPVVSGFNASEDLIDLRGTLLSSSTVTWDSNYADSQDAPVVGTDFLYNAYRTYGSLLNRPYSISGNTLSAGGSTTGQLVGYTDDSSWMPVMVFFLNAVGTITINNFILPGQSLPSSDTTPPSVTSVNVPATGNYRTGQALDFTVNFDETVGVSTTGGTPRIPLTLDTGGTVYANYISGGNSTALLFRYVVAVGNLDTTGISVGAAIQLNGGTLQDAAPNNATLTLNSVGSTTGVKVDGVAPYVTAITRKTPAAQAVNTGTVVFQVSLSEDVSNVTSACFGITGINGNVTANVASVSGGPQIYDVTVNITGGAGEFRLDVSNPTLPD